MSYASGGLITPEIFTSCVVGEQSTEAWLPVRASQQQEKGKTPDDEPWEYEEYHL